MELCFGRLPMQVTQPSDDFPHRFMPITLGVSRTNRVCYGIRDKKQTAWDIAVASRMFRYIFCLSIPYREEPKGVAIHFIKRKQRSFIDEKDSKRNYLRLPRR